MNINDAYTLATDLMRVYGLTTWVFEFDRARTRLGQCRYGSRTITLSAPLVIRNSESVVRNTILHEIAHALVPGDHHGDRWRAKALEIGCTGERCFGSDVVTPTKRRIGRCPGCGLETRRHTVRRGLACTACCEKFNGGRYDSRFAFVWS